MPPDVTRRRFLGQTLGVIGGATVSGELLPLLAEAAKRKPILRVAIGAILKRCARSCRRGIRPICCGD